MADNLLLGGLTEAYCELDNLGSDYSYAPLRAAKLLNIFWRAHELVAISFPGAADTLQKCIEIATREDADEDDLPTPEMREKATGAED